MAEKIAVLGIYPNYSSVENGVDVLKEAGFRNTDISVLFPEKVISKDFEVREKSSLQSASKRRVRYASLIHHYYGYLPVQGHAHHEAGFPVYLLLSREIHDELIHAVL